MAAQCTANGMWITTDAVRAAPWDPVEAAFSAVRGRTLAVCAMAGARPVPPVDREFLATGVLERPGRRKARRLMPCPDYPRVAAALRMPPAAGAACRRCGSPTGAGGRRRTR